MSEAVTYGKYLKIDELLSLQQPRDDELRVKSRQLEWRQIAMPQGIDDLAGRGASFAHHHRLLGIHRGRAA